ncbi:MAG TPA: hydrogenase maturation protease [Thermodesulfobacteriota bacterium]|nr:hydrogenase maturation protease [Thermodesulfobacteriota bacterium]
MEDISSALAQVLIGKTAFLGIGNAELGDDGFGVRMGEALREAGLANVLIAGTTPESHVTALGNGRYETVVFLDAVLSDAEPGSVMLMDAAEIKNAFPQVSTHKYSLGTLATIVCSGNGTKVWLLGVRPASTEMGTGLSGTVKETLTMLTEVITSARDIAKETSKRERICH